MKNFTIIFFCFYFLNSIAQEKKIKNDTTLIKSLQRGKQEQMGEVPFDTIFKKSKKILHLTLNNQGKFDKKSNTIYSIACGRALLDITGYFLMRVELDSAKYYNNLMIKNINDPLLTGISYAYGMRIHLGEKNYKKAIEYNQKALKHFTKLNAIHHSIMARIELSDIYKETENFDLALKVDSISLKMLVKDSLKLPQQVFYSLKSQLNTSYGGSLLKKNRLNEVFELLDEAETINDKIKLPQVYNYNNLVYGEAYYLKSDYNSAINYVDKDLKINKEINHLLGEFLDYTLLSRIYLKKGDLEKAISLAKKAEEMLSRNTEHSDPSAIGNPRKIYEVLYLAYKQKGNIKKALDYHEKFIVEKELQKNTTVAALAATTALEIEHEKEIIGCENKKRELEITNLQQKQRSFITIACITFVVLLLFFFFYIRFQKKILKTKIDLKVAKDINDLRAQFTENMSHEIRTPITISLGYLNLMNKNILNTHKLKKYIRSSITNNNLILEKANEFLNIIKIDSNNISNKIDRKNMVVFINEIIEPFFASSQIKNITIFFKSNIKSPLFLRFDYDKLEKIITNLITNSIKYSLSNSSIYITVIYSSKNMRFYIKDEGIGISKEEQKLIFDRFYQSNDNKISGGLGIGLALVKELTTYLGGTISLASEKNKGTSFTLDFPVDFENFDVELIKEIEYRPLTYNEFHEENEEQKINLPKALIIDDSIEMVKYLNEILKGYLNCDKAFNGEEALSKIKENDYQIIISDLRMPLMDGIELKKELNLNPELADIPFIMITANTYSKFKDLGFTVGINDYLVKPFNEEEIINRINNLLENNLIRINYLKNDNEKIKVKGDFTKTIEKIKVKGDFTKTIEKIYNILIENIDNTSFSVNDLAKACNYSQRQLTRVLKSKTGLTPIQIILEIRLQKAYELIIERKHKSIKEIIYAVGLNNRSYFNKVFKKRFGINPTDLKEK